MFSIDDNMEHGVIFYAYEISPIPLDHQRYKIHNLHFSCPKNDVSLDHAVPYWAYVLVDDYLSSD